jgi:DTW domain-containing protein YfiP
MTGEDFNSDLKLNTLLCDPSNECALLYPGESAVTLDSNFKARELTHIILIDGTWRKAKKIFMLSKNLQTLPLLKLSPAEKTDYRIRKAPSENSLSTLEAAVMALHFLEPDLNTTPAIVSFQKMIDIQINKMGREIYQTNYLDKKK